MTVPEKFKTNTQKIVHVTAEVAVASGKKVWSNLILLVFVIIFGGIGVAYFVSAGPLGKLCSGGITFTAIVLFWYFNRPQKDQTLNWNNRRGYFKRDDPE